MISALLLFSSSAALLARTAAARPALLLPSDEVKIPACPKTATIAYDRSVPDKAAFPRTQVDLCHEDTAIQITFTARDEVAFHFDPAHGHNDPLYEYSVMEAFVALGADDPLTYLEFEVSPNNVTFEAFILNPSRVRAAGRPITPAYVERAFDTTTELDRSAGEWTSTTRVPLGWFGVDEGKARGTVWRMNFFRTVTAPETFPEQLLGAWRPADEANFHITPLFGRLRMV